jgi:hypothetical protein
MFLAGIQAVPDRGISAVTNAGNIIHDQSFIRMECRPESELGSATEVRSEWRVSDSGRRRFDLVRVARRGGN